MGDAFEFGGEFAWYPSPAQIERSRLRAFMATHGLDGYRALLHRSTTDLEWFWRAVFDDLNIEFFTPPQRVVDTSAGIAWTRWCTGATLNIVHNCLDKRARTPAAGRIALRYESEDGMTRVLTYRELWQETNRVANALTSLGIARGERVALFMPMSPELIAAFFAIVKIGAVIVPLFSGYGSDAVATRLRDAEASLLMTVDGFNRRGQRVDVQQVAHEAVAHAPSVRHVIVLGRNPQPGDVTPPQPAGRSAVPAHDWDRLVSSQSDRCETVRTAAEDPVMVIYTSGTTGKPKGAVHTHCGFPVKAAQDMAHCFDVGDADTMFWVTDMGWMMGPWEAFGMTILGGTMLIYDGALDYPGPDRLWSLVARHDVSVLGVSPTLIRSLMKHGDAPVHAHDRSSLRILGSTGEPWNPESWRWFFERAGGGRLPVINYSGGTEVSGGLVSGNVLTPLKPCAFAAPPPGIAADVVDEHGNPLRNAVGELVVRQPWIGMTRGFWKDPERYDQTYWGRFPDVWVHGDWAAIDEDGQWFILGRSDDTIKIAGKRLGPAEVESVLVEHPGVIEAAAVGVPDATKGQALVCFCVLRPHWEPSDAVTAELDALVTSRLGKPLRPSAIYFVRDLPKTRNAKVMRRVIRAAFVGEPPGDLTALENPAAVEEIAGLSKGRTG